MQTKVGMPFLTNVLRVALNMKEEMIACVLVFHYSRSLAIDEKMIVRAIKTA
jgi:hypothetical protein